MSTQLPVPVPVPGTGPSEHDLRARYSQTPAQSPLDFIKQNLRSALDGQQIVSLPPLLPAPSAAASETGPTTFLAPGIERAPAALSTAASIPAPAVPPAPSDDPTLSSLDRLLEQQFAQSSAPAPETQDHSELPPDETGVPEEEDYEGTNLADGPRASLRNLRKQLNEHKNQLREVQVALQERDSRLERYDTGEEEPEVVQRLNNRIQDLEHYERLHALRLSPEYQRQFVAPLEALKDKATKLAEDYAVAPHVLDLALKFDNKRDLNQFLVKHFGDEVAALEAREVITEIKDTFERRAEAEQEPEQELARLRAEYQEQEQQQQQQRITGIINTSKQAWQQASKDLHNEQNFPELTLRQDDPKHNEVVTPILEAAAREFGQFMKLLGAAGIKELPPEAVKILAKRFQLSQAASVIAESRNQHVSRAQSIIENNTRRAPLRRPQVGSPAVAPPPPQNEVRGVAAFGGVLDNILRKRGK